MRKERDTQAYRQAIQHALEATRRLKALANDLLTLARVRRDGGEEESVAIEHAVEEARTLVAELALSRDVSLDVRLEDVASVPHRHHDLTRLFRNLIENAVMHSPAGGAVRIESKRDGDSLLTWISDQGPGVAPADRERIFEPFFRTPGSIKNREGAGLGLGIAREIARAHGGDVRLEPSAEPASTGARFIVVLPVA